MTSAKERFRRTSSTSPGSPASFLVAALKDPIGANLDGRVIEVPIPRWTAYDAKYSQVEMSDEVPLVTTQRSYTSPTWHTP
jgi:hypothetical protein